MKICWRWVWSKIWFPKLLTMITKDPPLNPPTQSTLRRLLCSALINISSIKLTEYWWQVNSTKERWAKIFSLRFINFYYPEKKKGKIKQVKAEASAPLAKNKFFLSKRHGQRYGYENLCLLLKQQHLIIPFHFVYSRSTRFRGNSFFLPPAPLFSP